MSALQKQREQALADQAREAANKKLFLPRNANRAMRRGKTSHNRKLLNQFGVPIIPTKQEIPS